jgi:ribosomal-protein-alanine N-acetyltransferase
MLPTLTTPRLLLTAATIADLDDLWRVLQAPDVRRYLCDDAEPTREQVAALLDDGIAGWPAGLGLWVIRGNDAARLGYLGLHPVSPAALAAAPHLAGEIEPTIALAPDRWGHGFATEALATALAYAFASLGRPRVVALVDEPNAASHLLMARLGFVPTGTVAGPRHPLRSHRLTPASFAAAVSRPGVVP